MAVIGGCSTKALEVGPSRRKRSQIPIPRPGVLAGQRAKLRDAIAKVGKRWVNNGVGTERGQDSSLPAGLPDRLVIGEGIQRGVGGRKHFDVEALIQRTRAELRRGYLRGDRVVVRIGGRRAQ